MTLTTANGFCGQATCKRYLRCPTLNQRANRLRSQLPAISDLSFPGDFFGDIPIVI
jgi:hypothetical protein